MDFRPITLPLPGIELAAVEAGSGPLALFFHGITANGHVFEPMMQALAARYRCVSFDQRGHGRSEKPASGYAGADFCGDIAAAIRHLAAGPAVLVGHSLGARNALLAGSRHPDLVRAVVAIEFTPFIEDQVLTDLETRVAGGDRLFATLDEIRAYLAGRYPLLPAAAVERRTRYGYAPAQGGFRPLAAPSAMNQTARGLREDLEPLVAAIACPTVLVRGQVSKLVSPEAWRRTRALRPDLPAVELDGADHYVPEEVPDACAGVLLDFMKNRT